MQSFTVTCPGGEISPGNGITIVIPAHEIKIIVSGAVSSITLSVHNTEPVHNFSTKYLYHMSNLQSLPVFDNFRPLVSKVDQNEPYFLVIRDAPVEEYYHVSIIGANSGNTVSSLMGIRKDVTKIFNELINLKIISI